MARARAARETAADPAGGGSVTPAAENGWTRRRRRIAEHIEGVALEIFASRGYRNVTVAEVAEAAGVSPRTLARYFPVKEDLLLSLPRRAVEGAIAELRTAWEEGHSVKDLWESWARLARANPAEVHRLELFWAAVSTVPEVLDRARGEQHQLVRTAITELIRTALPDGPRRDLHAQVVASALQAANGAVVEHWLRGDQREDLDVLFGAATEALVREIGGLGKPPRRRRRSA